MKFFRRKFLKIGNKGLSMVELICGITMLTIVGASVSSVLVVSADTYNRGSAEANVQQEAQLVANQISDLLIDATKDPEVDGDKLTIYQDGTTHTIEKVGNELYYSDGSTTQLLAEGVQSFDPDITQFSAYGYVDLELELKYKDTEQVYPANFTIMSRNKQTTKDVVVASVSMETDYLLEPFQDHDFNAIVTSSSTTSVSWELKNKTSSDTTIDSNGLVTIGKDEMSPVVRVVCTVKDTAANKVLTQKYANVYVRRVNDVTVSGAYDPVASNGAADQEAGATYNVTAVVDGSYLDQREESYDDDYVSPKKVNWSASSTGSTTVTFDTTKTGALSATFSLDSDMEENEVITITAKSAHADGENKSSQDYGDVIGTWTISSQYSPFDPKGGWLRESDQPQAEVDVTYLNNLCSSLGGANWEIQSKFVSLDGTEDSGWLDNEYGGDANGSSIVNIRPLITKMLDPMKGYNISIRVVIKDDAGNIIYPTSTTPEKAYMMIGQMAAVDLTFKSNVIQLSENATKNSEGEAVTFGSVSMGGSVQKEIICIDKAYGVEYARVYNETKYTLEKKVGEEWLPVDEALPGTAETQCSAGAFKLKFDQNKTAVKDGSYKGLYRVKVTVSDRQTYEMVDGELKDDGKTTWQLWDEESGDGIFYFNVID
ncbi:MAG: hypothetical protein II994_10040 [Lachnospiraceae bacterium]|nr:hypothetical protein [Lachnospiraceae bacterium]